MVTRSLRVGRVGFWQFGAEPPERPAAISEQKSNRGNRQIGNFFLSGKVGWYPGRSSGSLRVGEMVSG
jgi:hypothetical protein